MLRELLCAEFPYMQFYCIYAVDGVVKVPLQRGNTAVYDSRLVKKNAWKVPIVYLFKSKNDIF